MQRKTLLEQILLIDLNSGSILLLVMVLIMVMLIPIFFVGHLFILILWQRIHLCGDLWLSLSMGQLQVERNVVVLCAPGSGQNRFGTPEFFSSALLECLHCFVVPDLVCEVGVGYWELRRNVRYDIRVVNYSVSLRNVLLDVTCEILVSQPWLSKSVMLIAVSEEVVHVQTSKSRKGWTKTVASRDQFCISIECQQLLNFRSDVSLDSHKGIVKSLMDLAVVTIGVLDLDKIIATWVASKSTTQFWTETVLLKVTMIALSSGE